MANRRDKELKPQIISNFILAIVFSNHTFHHSFWKKAKQLCVISSPLIFPLPSTSRKMAKRMQAEEVKGDKSYQLDNSPYYLDSWADWRLGFIMHLILSLLNCTAASYPSKLPRRRFRICKDSFDSWGICSNIKCKKEKYMFASPSILKGLLVTSVSFHNC